MKPIIIFAIFAFSALFLIECTDKSDKGNVTPAVSDATTDAARASDMWTSKTGIVFSWIPAGTFKMGSPKNEPGRNSNEIQHIVTLSDGFYMSIYPVTQEQYESVMGNNPSYFQTVDGKDNPAKRPVENENWYAAIAFCNRLSIVEGLNPAYSISGSTNPDDWGEIPTKTDAIWDAAIVINVSTGYRLPTEAQWEYACRAGTTTAYNWGTDTINNKQANYDSEHEDTNNLVSETKIARTTEAESYAPNAWGLYDMHGNVWQWCWDWYGDYSSGDETDPSGAVSGEYRVVRGGSWVSYGQFVRSAYRRTERPHHRIYWREGIGFRLVLPS